MWEMMGAMWLFMLLGLLALLAVIGAVVYLGARAARIERPGTRRAEGGEARAVLERRLAAGEIDIEEYYERESALRSSVAPSGSRRHRTG